MLIQVQLQSSCPSLGLEYLALPLAEHYTRRMEFITLGKIEANIQGRKGLTTHHGNGMADTYGMGL